MRRHNSSPPRREPQQPARTGCASAAKALRQIGLQESVLSQRDNVRPVCYLWAVSLHLRSSPARRGNRDGDEVFGWATLWPVLSSDFLAHHNTVAPIRFPVAILEIYLEVISGKPHATRLVSAVQPLSPPDTGPNLHARDAGANPDRGDLPHPLAHVGCRPDLNRTQRLGRDGSRRHQV